jgi:hypothetical protein
VFLVNSRYPRFSATLLGSERKARHPGRHTFSRSYGVILPSSLSRVLSSALGYSPRLPESRSFSRKHGITEFVGLSPSSSPLGVMSSRLWLTPPMSSPYGLEPRPCGHARMGLSYPSSSLLGDLPWWCRNINLLPIAYSLRPRLRDRLTLGRLTSPRKP